LGALCGPQTAPLEPVLKERRERWANAARQPTPSVSKQPVSQVVLVASGALAALVLAELPKADASTKAVSAVEAVA
jgi:hypothetical protein